MISKGFVWLQNESRQYMNTAVLHTFGAAPRFGPFVDPVPQDGEALVYVLAGSLKPVDRQLAEGVHFARRRELPLVCGIDNVGVLDDGTRLRIEAERVRLADVEAAWRRSGGGRRIVLIP